MAIFKDGTRERIVGIGELGDGRTVDNVDISGIKLNSMPTAADGEITLSDQNVTNVGTVKLGEQAAAETDTAAYGQLWVKTATPNELYFTNDAGNDVQLTSGSAMMGIPADDISVGDAAVSVATSSGNVTVDSNAGSVLVDGHTGVQVTSSNSGEVDITSAAAVDINATTGVTIDGTTVSIDGTDTSNVTVTGSGKLLTVEAAGGGVAQELRLKSAGTSENAIAITASAGGMTVETAGEIEIGATGTSSFIRHTAGKTGGVAYHIDANAAATSEVQIDAGILDIDVTAGITMDGTTISIDGTDSTNLTMTANSSSAKALTIDAVNSGTGVASITLGTTSGTAVSIGHTTSETTVNDNLTITGDLTVNGTTTTINSTTLTVDDKVVVIASGAADSAAADGAGISVDGASATILYDHTGTQWEMNKPLEVTGDIATTGEIKTATLSFTDGDNAITIADGGAVTVAAGLTSTAATNALGATNVTGTVTVGVDDTGQDVHFYGATSGKQVYWRQTSNELLLSSSTQLSFHDSQGDENIVASADGHLEVNSGTTLDMTAPTVDVNASTTLTVDTAIYSIDGTDDSNVTVTGSGKDLDIAVVGGGTQEMRLASAGTGASAIHLNASAGGINVDSADMIDIDAADEITIDTTSADGHIAITSAHTAGQAVLISANANAGSILDIDAGIMDIDVTAAATIDAVGIALGAGSGELDLTTTGTLDVNANAMDMDLTDSSSITITSSEAAEDLTIEQVGANDSSIIIQAAGTGSDAIKINASAGSIDIDSADAITVDAADEIVVTTTSADGHISLVSAHTAGVAVHIDANANAGSIVDLDAGILDIDVTGAATIDAASFDVTSDAITFTGVLNVTSGIEVTTKGAIAGGSGSASTALAPASGSATTRAGIITITMQGGHTWSAGANVMGVQFNNTAIDADSVVIVNSNLANTPFFACNLQDNRCDFVTTGNNTGGDIGPGDTFVLNYVIL